MSRHGTAAKIIQMPRRRAATLPRQRVAAGRGLTGQQYARLQSAKLGVEVSQDGLAALVAALGARGVSDTAMADCLDVSSGTVRNWRIGITTPWGRWRIY